MSENLKVAIDELEADLNRTLCEAADLKRTINLLSRRAGLPEPYANEEEQKRHAVSTRPDEYYGQPFAKAVRDVLEKKGSAMPAQDILDALTAGGFDFELVGWKGQNRLRPLAISLAKNTQLFAKLPNGNFGLVKWYPEAAKRKNMMKNTGGSGDQIAQVDDDGESDSDEGESGEE